jgi:hypothetical protein
VHNAGRDKRFPRLEPLLSLLPRTTSTARRRFPFFLSTSHIAKILGTNRITRNFKNLKTQRRPGLILNFRDEVEIRDEVQFK